MLHDIKCYSKIKFSKGGRVFLTLVNYNWYGGGVKLINKFVKIY